MQSQPATHLLHPEISSVFNSLRPLMLRGKVINLVIPCSTRLSNSASCPKLSGISSAILVLSSSLMHIVAPFTANASTTADTFSCVSPALPVGNKHRSHTETTSTTHHSVWIGFERRSQATNSISTEIADQFLILSQAIGLTCAI